MVWLKESRDHTVKGVAVEVQTGHNGGPRQKWKARLELARGEPVRFWSKALRKERMGLVIEKVARTEQERYLIKAVSQSKQRAWTRLEGTIHRVLTWKDI